MDSQPFPTKRNLIQFQFVLNGKFNEMFNFWDFGISRFIWNVKTILESLETLAPEVANIFKQGLPIYGTESEADFIKEHYPNSPNISIDYAIMEKASNVYTIPAAIGWSDLGMSSSQKLVQFESIKNINFHIN